MKYSLAFDFGATSFRGILGWLEQGQFKTKEVLRCEHERVDQDGRSRWQLDFMLQQITQTILAYKDDLVSIGVDTWGVDCGLVNADGKLVENPVSYRDPRHQEGFSAAHQKLSSEQIFLSTGNQIMPINTLFQLLTLQQDGVLAKAQTVLMLPDLFNYLLTGNKYRELTIASTSQLIDLRTQELSPTICHAYGLNPELFPASIRPGELVGTTAGSLLPELAGTDIKVIAVPSHDTASAVLMTEAYSDHQTAFLSCGTWSLIGCLTPAPVISSEAFAYDLTNETGYNGVNMFFKNITGLYIIEMLKQSLEQKQQRHIDYAEITAFVEQCDLTLTVDVDDPLFAQNSFDVIAVVDKLTGTHLSHELSYFKVIYLSLAKKYKEVLGQIEQILGYRFTKLHMIGGGVKSKFLCNLIAEELQLPVVAGPDEATAFGNLLTQKLSLQEFSSLDEGRKVILSSSPISLYNHAN